MSARRLLLPCLALALLLFCLAPGVAAASFGIESLSTVALNRDGKIDGQAGSHPFEWTLNLQMNLGEAAPHFPEGTLRSLIVDLPPGMIGDPLATPRCSRADFEGVQPRCPADTQIGFARVPNLLGVAVSPVYNLVPPLGVPASVGFSVDNANSFQEASVRTGADYGATVSDITVPTGLAIQAVTESIWGVPADPAHDAERWCFNSEGGVIEGGCTTEAPELPFFTLPTSCTGPLTTTVHVESLQEPGKTVSMSAVSENEEGEPEGLRNCEAPPFAPTITVQPETTAADSPTGLHVALHSPQNENPDGLATADLRETTIDLPPGLVVDPSAAAGLGACSLAQVDLHGAGPADCPPASKLGTVSVGTPLVDHPLPGAVYLARQGENPFNSLLALYIAVYDPLTGVVVKLAGEVEPDPQTGRLRATFAENPQLPFEDLSVDFAGGPRASLTTPETCGTYTTTSVLVPWTAPEGTTASPSDPFTVGSAPGGGPCASSEAQMPNSPSFEAGTTSPLAGTYSPFVLRLGRENGTQRFRALNATLPLGLAGRIAGVAECSDAQIARALARSNPGEGALEQAAPSCPASSEVGVVDVGAGSGAPFHVQGHAYLAGPYKGAPLSLVIITPAVAGPFDLGTVVVRSALYVNEETGQISVRSDPIPTILDGIPLDVRSIAVQVSRNQFALNPTSCEASSVAAEAISTTGSVAKLNNRFQVGGCRGLEFHPQISLQLKGATKRAGHPALKAVITFPHKVEEANAASIQVGLPHALFLDQGNLDKVCTRPQLASRSCPSTSVYGHVKAYTPLFEEPLTGPVYIGVGFGYKLPALVTELNGKVRILAHGRVDTTRQNGLRNTFEFVPDAPISRIVLEMKGGKKYGLLEISENLCAKTQRANARLVAHNGLVAQLRPKIATSCTAGPADGRRADRRRARH
jgi:hypothetical protein